jgi:hypothetical protein
MASPARDLSRLGNFNPAVLDFSTPTRPVAAATGDLLQLAAAPVAPVAAIAAAPVAAAAAATNAAVNVAGAAGAAAVNVVAPPAVPAPAGGPFSIFGF